MDILNRTKEGTLAACYKDLIGKESLEYCKAWDDYYRLRGLENLYLENSFVMCVKESQTQIEFVMDFVLTEDHESYSPPSKDKQYCYKEGKIVFPNVKKYKWLEKNPKLRDVYNEDVDYGSIDVFLRKRIATTLKDGILERLRSLLIHRSLNIAKLGMSFAKQKQRGCIRMFRQSDILIWAFLGCFLGN